MIRFLFLSKQLFSFLVQWLDYSFNAALESGEKRDDGIVSSPDLMAFVWLVWEVCDDSLPSKQFFSHHTIWSQSSPTT